MKLSSLLIALMLCFTANSFPQKMGDAYALDINNIYLPLNRKGVLADVNVSPGGTGGQFGGEVFLFSGGFFLSGNASGQMWANAVASASLVEDYLQGFTGDPNNPDAQLYKLRSDDQPFGQSWQDWVDAVALGADFYDGNGDQIYDPIDLNANGIWDPDEDHPDLLGDEMLWCIYHDGVPIGQRRWNTSIIVGVNIEQSIFSYSSVPDQLGNIVFIRYRINNTGLVADELTDVYFGIWDDPDLGDAQDDLVGCDTILASGFTYNDGSDTQYGTNPPCFSVKTLAGPVTYIPGETFIDNNGNGIYDEGIDTPLDTAYVHRGQLLGIKEYPGAKNQTLSSSIHYMNGDPIIRDPDNKEEARNYMLGLTLAGDIIDPCNWTYGEVRGGVNCSQVNPFFWYSGDPVTDVGWINIYSTDQRQMTNVGPFTLREGEEVEVLLAYVVGRGNDALSSITEARNIANTAGELYYCNFDTTCITSVISQDINSTVNEYNLHQNYPNPFNPSTKIKFTLPSSGFTTLKIFNALGETVEVIVNNELNAGTYEIEWDASRFQSGVYFYQLRVTDPESGSGQVFVETKKMLLLK